MKENPTTGIHFARRRIVVFGSCAAALVALVGLTLPSYGYTFDEVLGALFKGESILEFWTHGDTAYLDTVHNHIDYYDGIEHPDFQRGSRAKKIWQFYAFPKTISAVCCKLLRPWVRPIDAHHLAIVLIALIGLWYIYRTAWEEAGILAAVAAFWIVALHPRMFAHLHNNLKDACVATLMAAAILTFRRATMRQSARTLLWAAALTALALGSKLNAVFIPVIGLPWLVSWCIVYRSEVKRRWLLAWLAVPFVTVGVWCLIDPIFINDPSQFGAYYRFFSEVAGGGIPHWNWLGLKKFLTCTPPSFIAFFIVGLGVIIWRRRWLDLLFFGWWFALPILRVCVPGAKDCDGIRHYLECLMPFAIVAAVGMATIGQVLAAKARSGSGRTVAWTLTFGALLAPAAWSDWYYHPYQTVYYNCFVGGYQKAEKHRLRDGDYWCSSYREVIDWILEHDLKRGVIDATYGAHILQYYSDIVGDRQWLVNTPEGDEALARGTRLYLIRSHDGPPERYKCQIKLLGDPIYQIERDGRVIVSLYAIDLPKIEGSFTIDPRGAVDQRLEVGQQIGERREAGRFARAGEKAGFLVYGPRLRYIEEGTYRAAFELILDGDRDRDAPVCIIDVFDAVSKSKLAARELRTGDFAVGGQPREFGLMFAVVPGQSLEFRVYHLGGTSFGCRRIRVDVIELPDLSRGFSIDPRGSSDQRLQVKHQIGVSRGEGWYADASDKIAFQIYGPYLKGLKTGTYRALFDFVLDGDPSNDLPVGVVDVYDSTSDEVLAKVDVRTGDFAADSVPRVFELQFQAEPGQALEFRVYHLGEATYGVRQIRVEPIDDQE